MEKEKKIEIYDTTLRDGAQGETISFTLTDQIKIAEKLDEFGIPFIEGGWPGSNPKAEQFFKEIKTRKFINSRIISFGSTRRKNTKAENDLNLKALLKSETEYITIFGKSWDLHVKDVFKISLLENLKMIEDSVNFLIKEGRKVFFDAEHFFDGFKNNRQYAIDTLKVSQNSGAERIILCDTNGGSLPFEIENIIKETIKFIKTPLGIHTHNDSGLAVANSIIAVKNGVIQVHGTINGFGERCGNADLVSIIPILQIKMGCQCIKNENFIHLTNLSRTIYEIANIVPAGSQPFVGFSAFTHKAGVHIDAVSKNPETYEHIDPAKVGNKRKILVSELSGKSAIIQKLKKDYEITKESDVIKNILNMVGDLEKEGYQFESAEASFDLMVRKFLGKYQKLFEVEGFRVIVEEKGKRIVSEATVKIKVGNLIEHTASEGDGPVNALDNALRKALTSFYPELKEMKLTDYKVRILHPEKATGAVTRVLIESTDEKDIWGTIGLSENIIEASWKALIDSFEYKLLKGKNTH
ncbi:MAG: citramalate synthase [Candidatus Omnitrophica bacterium]|nr:citramalate synthase [Candidatus Omnitrophota bacterium]